MVELQVNIGWQNQEPDILDVVPPLAPKRKKEPYVLTVNDKIRNSTTGQPERKRNEVYRMGLQNGIKLLRQHVPGTEKMTQPNVLMAAVNYIVFLEKRNQKMQENLEECMEPLTLIDLSEDSTPEESVPMDESLSPVASTKTLSDLLDPENIVPVISEDENLPELNWMEGLMNWLEMECRQVIWSSEEEDIPDFNSTEKLMDWLGIECPPVISSEEEDLPELNSLEELMDWLGIESPPVISSSEEEEDLPELNSLEEFTRWVECASA